MQTSRHQLLVLFQSCLTSRKVMRLIYLSLVISLLAVILLNWANAYPRAQRHAYTNEDDEPKAPLNTDIALTKPQALSQEKVRDKRFLLALVVLCIFLCGKSGGKSGGQSAPPPPIDGAWSRWQPLTACSKTCGGGTQQLQRHCDDPAPQHGGQHCKGSDVKPVDCNNHINCPINGHWSSWTEEGICKESRHSTERLFCGKGVRKRSRTCSEPRNEFGGHPCQGISSEHVECDAGECPGCFHPPVPLGVQYFTDEGLFTGSDPTNVTTPSNRLTRQTQLAPTNSTSEWVSADVDKETDPTDVKSRSKLSSMHAKLNRINPTIAVVDSLNIVSTTHLESSLSLESLVHSEGTVGLELTYIPPDSTAESSPTLVITESDASEVVTTAFPTGRTTGLGPTPVVLSAETQPNGVIPTSTAVVYDPTHAVVAQPNPTNLPTTSDPTDTTVATVSPNTAAVFNHDDVLSFGCLGGFNYNVPPVDGPFHTLTCSRGEWKGITLTCSDINECTDGVHGCDPVRSNCTNTNGGFKCYCKASYQQNEAGECEGVPVHGWGVWRPSGSCTVTCGGGLRRFDRSCNNPKPQHGGRPCGGEDYKYEPCNTQCCPVHGEWSEWIDGACSKTCGYGVHKRYRSCEGPYCGGQDCTGVDEVEVECNQRSCQCCPIPDPSSFPGLDFILPEDSFCSNSTSLQHDAVLAYTCEEGFYSVFDEESSSFPSIVCNGGIWEGDSPECKDMNECDLNIHECNPETSICANTLGSYKCYCKNGFKMAADGKTCEDIDECEDNNGACKEHCRNDFGSYQCYCPDDFELAEDGLSCLHPSSECPDLPTPKHASKTCTKVSYGLTCDLVCHEDYEFSGTYDPSPQTCVEGVWSYQIRKQEMPDCQAVQDSWLSFDTFLDGLGDCDPSSEYDTNSSSLLGPLPGRVPSSASAECSSSGRKRSTGSLRLAVRLAVRVTPSCLKNSACRSWHLRVLYSKAIQLRSVVSKGTTQVTVTNKHTQETKAVTLSGFVDLRKAKLGIACNPGSVVVGQNCVPCGQGYYFSDAGKCSPCALHTYQNKHGRLSCAECPSGTFTTNKASKSAESCLAPCPAGSYSATGLEPCNQCSYGSYQYSSGKNFCYLCSFGLITDKEGSTVESSCGCPDGKYWQGCSKNCTCLNGGQCRIDGKCDCPRGWTGTDCSNPKSISSQCQDTYMVAFFDNYRSRRPRHIILLTANHKADVDAYVGDSRNHSTARSTTITADLNSGRDIPIDADTPYVYQLSLYAADMSTVIGYNSERKSSDAFAGLPVQLLGENEVEEFIVISYSNTKRRSFSSVVLVVASEDNTSVEVTSSQDGTATPSGSSSTSNIVKTVRRVFTLHRYEKLQISSQHDLTGTKVKSNRPLAVYSGNECGVIPSDAKSCDHMVEQLPPVNVWGRTYIAAPFLNQTAKSLIKIVASENNTWVNLVCRAANGNVVYNRTVGPLSSGDSHQEFVPAEEYMYISSDKPVLVGQFITSSQSDNIGDPSMVVLPSTDQAVRQLAFYSFDVEPADDFNHFVTIVVPAEYSSPTSLEFDNLTLSEYDYHSTSLQTSFGDFVVYRLEVSPGYHYLHHNNPEAGFILTVYGLDIGASYAYAPGLNQAMSCERKLTSTTRKGK